MSGYNEIQNPPSRYGVIDHSELQRLCGFTDAESFKKEYRQWVEDALGNGDLHRESCWTESVAVGSRSFIEDTKVHLAIKAVGRRIQEPREAQFVLREETDRYSADFAPEKAALSPENAFFWDDSAFDSAT